MAFARPGTLGWFCRVLTLWIVVGVWTSGVGRGMLAGDEDEVGDDLDDLGESKSPYR